jgi:hypothetical protein
MGLQVDLTVMLNAPKNHVCRYCRAKVPTHFDDYDIECGNPNPSPGIWEISAYCPKCETERVFRFKVLRCRTTP